jgi:hypothetical protein
MDEDLKAKRRRQAAERRAWRKEHIHAWQVKVDQHFHYLIQDFGYRVSNGDISAWVTNAIYRSSTTAVSVDRSVEFDCVEIYLMRLIDRKIPQGLESIQFEPTLNRVYLGSILSLRGPQAHDTSRTMIGLSDEQIEKSLAFWAGALRYYATDVLQGDFAVFEQIKAYRNKQT